MNTREKLLSEAIRLFAQEGYERVTVTEVVEAAKLTKGAFYYYYESKEDLLAEIHLSYVDFALERFECIVAGGARPTEILAQMLRELVDQIHDHRYQVVILWESHRSLSPEASQSIDAKKAEIRRLFQRTIENGQRVGEFSRDHDPRLAALGVFGMTMWTYHWYRPDGIATVSEIAAEFTRLVVGGLRAGDAGGAVPAGAEDALAL